MIIPIGWNNDNSGQEKADAMTRLISFPDEITLSENLRNFLFRPVETAPGSEAKASLSVLVNGYIAPGEKISVIDQAIFDHFGKTRRQLAWRKR